ncbi:hypothetical protein ACFWPX_18255 [Nocardia sp. NPDC058518]|uniref:hypothetical protein n=1 Tax=Nocardia sp. NPDC058518 TaxID=3346534 RepID=UPI00364BAA84
MHDETDSPRTELEHRLRLALTSHPTFEVRPVGRRELRVARPYDHNMERTPYRFSLLLEEKRRFAVTVEHWSSDGGTPLRRDRDREQPVRNLIAAELAELGWKPGRSAVGWTIAVLSQAAWAVLFLVVSTAVLIYFTE